MRKLQIALLAALVVGMLAVPNLMFAESLQLIISDGIPADTYNSGLRSSPINIDNQAVGNFSVTAQATGLPTFALPNLLDLFNLAITSGAGGGTLTIMLTEINIPVPLGSSIFQTNIGGSQSAGSSLDYTTCMDPANHNGTSYGCGAGTNQIGHFHFTSQAYSGSSSVLGTNTGVYSVTELVTLVMGANNTTSFDAIDQVPEPATLSVLGFGLFALGTGLRRKLSGASAT
jgi:hypothetical protein